MPTLTRLVQSTRPVFSTVPGNPDSPKRGDEGDRTLNPRLAKPVLSQLSYVPGGRGQKPDARGQ